MATEGLSNREIGEQLYLPLRTVGGALYRSSRNWASPRAASCTRRSRPEGPRQVREGTAGQELPHGEQTWFRPICTASSSGSHMPAPGL